MKKVLTSMLLLGAISVFAQTAEKLKEDRDAIMSMCGCYKVEFRYAEVYSPDTAYKFHDREYTWAYELVTPIENSDKKVSLQHMLVVDEDVVKHWRQDWMFENTTAHLYDKDSRWMATNWSKKEVAGQWTQKVYQVDDSPRYSGSGTWVHVDGKHYWESVADSPLPRREITTAKRTDYNVLVRNNRQEITKDGWMHRQDNQKVLRTDGAKDKLIAHEEGWNTYTKAPEKDCALAKAKWEKDQKFWAAVRQAWANVEAKNENLKLKLMVDGGVLYEKVFSLAKKYETLDEKTLKKEIDAILKAHIAADVAVN